MGRVRRAWRKGVREEPVSLRPSTRRPAQNLADRGRARCVPPFLLAAGTSREDSLSRPGRPWGRSAAYLWRGRRDTAGLLLRRADDSETREPPGTGSRRRASGSLAGIGAPAAERAGWGGAAVVLRGRESRSHGEGRQRF